LIDLVLASPGITSLPRLLKCNWWQYVQYNAAASAAVDSPTSGDMFYSGLLTCLLCNH